MNAPKYVIDTCSLTKMRREYPKDIFPTVWEKLTELAENGVLISAEDVLEELKAFDDEVLDWANNQDDLFVSLDEDIQKMATLILTTHPGLLDLKRNKSSADPFLIATAQKIGCIVVTEEKTTNSPNRPKIPNVCKDLGVECIDLLEMLRREELKV